MEMFGIVETLQHTVMQLEAERDAKAGLSEFQSMVSDGLDRNVAISELGSSSFDTLLDSLQTKIQALIDNPNLPVEQRQQELLTLRQMAESLQRISKLTTAGDIST